MKRNWISISIVVLIIAGWGFTSCAQNTTHSYKSEIQNYRDSIDGVFKDARTSILLPEDRAEFEGLDYFPIDSTYRVKVDFVQDIGEPFEMLTTTERVPIYRKYGIVSFVLNGDSLELTVYQDMGLLKDPDYADYLFCPFKDLTNAKESYGGGRYLDMTIGSVENGYIDFNKAYNPYCAYNYKYSCPIPPVENHLKVRIEAGVKGFH